MPFFPKRLAVSAVLVLASAAVAVPLASADDHHHEHVLKHRQHLVQGRLHSAQHDLDESSKSYSRATARLEGAQHELSQARARLERVRDRLGAARKQAARLQRELKEAQARLDKAAQALRDAKAEVENQRQQVRGTVLEQATDGNPVLQTISSYLDSGSVEDVMTTDTASGLVVGLESDTLDALQVAEAAVEDHKDDVEAARNAVQHKKDAADRTVHRVAGLVSDARDTKERVDRLVLERTHARRAALNARRHDREALERLQARENRIKDKILRLSQQQSGSYVGPADGLLMPPVSGPVTSPFGWRIHPIYGYWGLHNGTDFGAPCGAPLVASASGTVIDEHYDSVYGNRLYLAIGKINGDTITLVYNHMSSYKVGQGAHVARGQVLGYVGQTGWATGCHLHFIVERNGTPVDPMQYL
ncbi:peptidoglycan DD-metalloendopeptidase family protein [Nocardioides panacisoli]|uniref:M23ase beta-sheet core domain-containing protein n=1 Tax=Nocardioides panacisoli TaxID=627624 RepID=A0ABP7IGQ1_9ACTN